ncbi:DUF6607 family protein [Emticicia fluvialis]|uniref:DUF6607 family protein n=1 Tax=Emticicia fluvialis TaxID=2974474 RepID=UPI0021655A54|nr:DUF6607 family protein [Emticicia fluvialis]
MKKTFMLLLAGFGAFAQKSADIAAIKAQCGCHEVKFDYAETFSPNKEYKLSSQYHAKGTEYVFVVEESKDKIVIQHLLAIGDTMVVKHWREDWTYEDPTLFSFYKESTWKYTPLEKNTVKKGWSQKVYEVEDGPRYEGFAQWSHINGKHLWESKVDAPLPRREYTKRKDYNVLKRGNRIYVTDYGYLHEQDNDKVLRKDGKDLVLVQEKGLNDYRRLADDKACEVTKKWWAEHGAFWADVRAEWQGVFDQHKTFTLKQFVRSKMLSEHLEAIEKEKNDSATNRKKIKDVLTQFVTYNTDEVIGKN